jgi:isopentenyl phosphate kinase
MDNQSALNPNLIFLKLGGSLITDKGKPHTIRENLIARLAEEIKKIVSENPNLSLLLGHGSGSFGHVPAKKYQTRLGVQSEEEWKGFGKVWLEARRLNQIVIEALNKVSIPSISFPASSCAISIENTITYWDLTPINAAIDHHIMPVVYGDVIFDDTLGGSIVSTEEIFSFLARRLLPTKIFLAGHDNGVFFDYPHRTTLIPEITDINWERVSSALDHSQNVDVTGGMRTKVNLMLNLSRELPGLEVFIFSGTEPGNLYSALKGNMRGTRITNT